MNKIYSQPKNEKHLLYYILCMDIHQIFLKNAKRICLFIDRFFFLYYNIFMRERIDMNNYFPNADFTGKIYNVDGVLYLVREPIEIINLEGELELGWDANNLNDNCSYHFFTETELKDKTIQEF